MSQKGEKKGGKKRGRKPKTASSTTSQTTIDYTATAFNGSPKRAKQSGTSEKRTENSLSLLTTRFLDLLQSAPGGIQDLNDAAVVLATQKRRVYDITNVLEGIGLIEKQNKNKVKWLRVAKSGLSTAEQVRRAIVQAQSDYARSPDDFESSDEEDDAELLSSTPAAAAAVPDDREIRRVLDDEARLDADICIMQQSLRDMADNEDNQKLGFVTYDDIRRLPKLKNETIIAIKAPPGTRLRVPDPDDGMPRGQRRYQIFLKSDEQPIDVYLVSEEQQNTQQTSSSNNNNNSSTNAAKPSSSTTKASTTATSSSTTTTTTTAAAIRTTTGTSQTDENGESAAAFPFDANNARSETPGRGTAASIASPLTLESGGSFVESPPNDTTNSPPNDYFLGALGIDEGIADVFVEQNQDETVSGNTQFNDIL